MKYILTGKSNYTLIELKEKWKNLKFDSNSFLGFRIVRLIETDEIIGECALLKTEKSINEEVEIAYMIDKKFWKKGYGKEICENLIDYAFQNLKTNKIIAGMYAENENSINLVKKFGFKLSKEGISKSGIHFKEFELKNS